MNQLTVVCPECGKEMIFVVFGIGMTVTCSRCHFSFRMVSGWKMGIDAKKFADERDI